MDDFDPSSHGLSNGHACDPLATASALKPMPASKKRQHLQQQQQRKTSDEKFLEDNHEYYGFQVGTNNQIALFSLSS